MILNSAEEIRQIYATGQGTIKLRGTYEPHPDRPNAVLITSIPYGIEKDALVERIGELIAKGQVPQLTNVKDLSTDDIRILLELKPGANADAALAYLFKNSPLQINYSINLTCLLPADGAEVAVPGRLDLKTILQQFLDFRLEVVTRRLQFELRNLLARIHILEGFAIVFKNLDEAIAIIRDSDGKADAAPKLIARFELSELQADAVLETKLYRLGKLEIRDILNELAQKRKRAKEIQQLLDDEPARWEIIRGELKQIAQTFGEPRRTRIEVPHGPDGVPRGRLHRRRRCLGDRHPRRLDQAAEVVHRRRQHPGSRRRPRRLGLPGQGTADDHVLHRPRHRLHDAGQRHADDDGPRRADPEAVRVRGPGAHRRRRLPRPALPARLEQAPPDAPRVRSATAATASSTTTADADHGHGTAGNGNGNGDGAALPPPPYAIALTAGGKVLRFALAPAGGGLDSQGPAGRPARPGFKGDLVVGVEATDGSENVCLATQAARVLIFPVTEANIVAGAARGVTAIRLDSKDRVHRLRPGQQETRGPDRADQPRRHQIVRATKYPVTGRGGKGYAILQRGSLDSVVPAEAEPVPSLEEIGESQPNRNGTRMPIIIHLAGMALRSSTRSVL